MIAAIVAVDENWGIGKDGKLLFHIPEDLKFFKETTKGSAVIMGRKTWDSLPVKPLKDRLNIVVTTGEKGIRNNALFIGVEDAMKILDNAQNTDDYFIIGGESIYRKFLPYCESVYVTKIYADGQADKFFPDIDKEKNWILYDVSSKERHNGIEYQFVEYYQFKDNGEIKCQ